MIQKAKLNALKEYLDMKGVGYVENYNSSFNVTIDLKVPEYKIAVFISRGAETDSATVHAKHGDALFMRYYHPIFIRENEDMDFIIGKYEDVVRKVMAFREFLKEKELRKQRGQEIQRELMARHEENMRLKAEKAKRSDKPHPQPKIVMRQRHAVASKYEKVQINGK